MSLDTPASALAIGAHPDDIEFGAGATLAKWGAEGCVVNLLVCTDGSKGTWNPEMDPAELAAQRQREQLAAARTLGATGEVRFLGEVDGELEERRDLRSAIALAIRELTPEIVLGHDPWQRYRLHPDHRHAGFLTIDAVVAARDPHFFAEHGIAHHRPSAMLLFEADEPDHTEIVTATDLDVKIRALLAHESQHVSTHFHRLDDPGLATTQGTSAAAAAFGDLQRQLARLDDGSYAERFKLINDL